MRKILFALFIVILGVGLLSAGCIKKDITDHRIIDDIQAFLDQAPNPSNPDVLTADERAAIEKFDVYKNTAKVQLKEGTDQALWSPIGTKIVKVFSKSERDLSKLESSYYVELDMMAMVKDKKKNVDVGDIRLENATDRIYPTLHNPNATQ